MRLLIIEPWFGAIGHPAQSLINMASAIGKDERVEYLVSMNSDSEHCLNSMQRLKTWGNVHGFSVRLRAVLFRSIGCSSEIFEYWQVRCTSQAYFIDET